MKNVIFVRNFIIFFLLLSVCVGSLGFYIYRSNKVLDLSDNWVFHTQAVIIESQELIVALQAMVASQRGYLLSGDEAFLNSFKSNREKASQHLGALNEKTQYNPSQQTRLSEIQHGILQLSNALAVTVERAQASSSAGARYTYGDLQANLNDEILRVANKLLSEEYTLLAMRAQALEARTRQYHYTLMIGGIVAASLLLIFNGFLLQAQSRRNEAEKSLRLAEERLHLAIRGSNDGIFDWNLVTNELYWSTHYKRMLGYEDDELESSVDTFNTLLHEDEKDALWTAYNEYINGNMSEFSHIFRMKHKSGRWIWIHARGKATYNVDGKAERFIGAHTDITHLKEYEQQLEDAKENAIKANRAKSEFLAHMSHEIRTPLTAISGIVEILDQNIQEFDAKKQKLIHTLGSSAASLKDLITDILDFSKIESGEIDLHPEIFSLDELFSQVLSITAVRASEKNLNFNFDYQTVRNAEFYGDKARVRQILINLIGNAIKFTDKGFVRVIANFEEVEEGEILKIVVADSGIGIAPSSHEMVFEKFRQADSSVSRRYGGTGLGLAISRNLAELMGGKITLVSALGTGSTFTVLLPVKHPVGRRIHKEGEAVRIQKMNDRLAAAIDGKPHILLVEDYEGNIVVLGHVLESMSCQYDVARTGVEALSLWKQKHYDVILMDVQMPEMDGLTATRHIREMEGEQAMDPTPIIGLTAHALVADKEKCIESGMNDYLSKPIDEAALKQTILKYLENKQPDENHQAA